jgi:hypothetical protein
MVNGGSDEREGPVGNDDLIGWSFQASIGEPWDFSSEDGQGYLRGTVVEVIEKHGAAALACHCSKFVHQGKEIRHILAISRNTGVIFPSIGGINSCNFLFWQDGVPITSENIDDVVGFAIAGLTWLIGSFLFDRPSR